VSIVPPAQDFPSPQERRHTHSHSQVSVAHPNDNVASGHQASAQVFQSRKGRDHKEDLRKPIRLDRTIDAVADHRRRENSRQSADHVRHV